MTKFRPTDRLTNFLVPPSVDEWLPQGHLARFVVEVVDRLYLSAIHANGAANEARAITPLFAALFRPDVAIRSGGTYCRTCPSTAASTATQAASTPASMPRVNRRRRG